MHKESKLALKADHDISRRAFLAASATGAAALGLSAWLEGTARAADADAVVSDALVPPVASDVHLGGFVGDRIDLCLRHRVMAQDIETLIKPFRARTEVGDGDWRCEYWGKWYMSAVLACNYKPAPENVAVVEKAARDLIATQGPDGYIGTRKKESRLLGWDVWGRKYVLLGLLAYYDRTGDKSVLEVAKHHADSLLDETGPGKANIAEVGYAGWKGLPPSSVLEPTVLLYRRTGDAKYLDYARYIVGQWTKPNRLTSTGLRLIDNARNGTPAGEMVSTKAYEMTSCYEGVCELYRATGDPAMLEAVTKYGDSIIDTELFIVGSGSSREVWFGGKKRQTVTNPDPMETCVTATWMKYCYQLLRLTGNSKYADQMEISLYNALLGALKPDGTWWGYYIPMEGTKTASLVQHADIGLSCCVCSGPRALMLTPLWGVMTGPQGLTVNLYNPGSAVVTLKSGNRVKLVQETDYPKSGSIRIAVEPSVEETFAVRLRIPQWSERVSLKVNGANAHVATTPGTYASIERKWNKGDKITLDLDMRGRAVVDPGGSGRVALVRGPIVLSQDRRLQSDRIDPPIEFRQDSEHHVDLRPAKAKRPGVWMAFEASGVSADDGSKSRIALCDYASAGNTWTQESTFRVWMPQPLDGFGALGFKGASWIWYGGEQGAASTQYAPARDFPVGTCYFRKTFELPADAKPRWAGLRITADDRFKLSIDGEEVGEGERWETPQTFDLTRRLKPGRNVLAVEVTNTTVSPAGLIAHLSVRLAGKPAIDLTTDATWKSADSAGAAWTSADFTDAGWHAAQVVGAIGSAPWGRLE